MIKLVCVAVAVLVPILFIAAMAGIAASAASGANSSDCTVAGASSVGMAGYQPDQMTNAGGDHSAPPSETPSVTTENLRKSFRYEKSLTDTRHSSDTLRCVKHRNSFIRT
jgi:hypothetical protein